ncbi:MAG: hypothetical protein ACOC45_03455 [Alkalispirochaetaceae bacterium]
MRTTLLGLLLRLHLFLFILVLLGVLLYAVGGFQGFLPYTQSTLLRLSQYLSVAAALSGVYVIAVALLGMLRGGRRAFGTVAGVLFSSTLCAGVTVMTLFFEAMIQPL